MILHIAITRWSVPKSDWLCSLQPKMEKFYVISKNKTWNWLWLRSWTPYCKFRLKLKKARKATRPFRYDLNQVPYAYITITRWSIPISGWLCSLQPKWRSSIWSVKIKLGTDCGSGHEFLIPKFRLKLKKVGKTRPFRYDLNQIPYAYTVEVMKRFGEWDVIERKKESEVIQSCPTLCNPMDYSIPGSSIHWIFQARVLEWVAISFCRGSYWPRAEPVSLTLQADALLSEPPGKPCRQSA